MSMLNPLPAARALWGAWGAEVHEKLDKMPLVVTSTADLGTPVGDEYVLPAGLVVISGQVDLGDKAVRISTDTVLRGFAEAALVSVNTVGVVRATNIQSALIMRELSIVAPAGPCLALVGDIDFQLNLFFVGLIGASAGTISGFNVQSAKQCYIQCAQGLTFGGATRKVFVSESPFYGVTGSAITLAADLTCAVLDLTTAFFKFDAPGVAVTAEPGYQVGDGLMRGCLIDGTATPLAGLDPSDVNWKMTDNTGVRDSVVAGQAALTAPAATDIISLGAYVPVTGTFMVSSFTERFEINAAGEFVYTGRYPALVQFTATFTVDPTNNVRVGFRATKNGAVITESQAYVEQGAGTGSSPRQGSVVALERVVTGDRIGLTVANLTDATDIQWLAATYVVKG